jgi:hypothetical protein
VRTQVDRDLTTIDYFDRLLGLLKNLGRHKRAVERVMDLVHGSTVDRPKG